MKSLACTCALLLLACLGTVGCDDPDGSARPHAAASDQSSRRLSSPPDVVGSASPAPTQRATPAQAPPATEPVRPCRAGDLTVRFRREGEGAGGHYAALLDFGNVGRTRCSLSGYPLRVTLSEPGHRPVTAGRATFFPIRPSRPMPPGGVTTLIVETVSYCAARPTGRGGPGYHRVTVAWAGGVVSTTMRRPRGLSVGCGAFASKFGRWL